MRLTGREQRFHPDYSRLERLYIAALGVPVVGLRIRARNVLQLIPRDLRPRRVLDAGSGPGVITFALADRFPDAEVVGVDLDAEAVRASRVIAERAGYQNARFERGDLCALRDAGFDLVTCVDILEHVEDDDAGVLGLARCLEPGGTLVLHVPSRFRRYPLLAKAENFAVPTHVRPGYDLDEIVHKARRAGLEVVDAGQTYGLCETLANNVSYMVTKAEKKNRELYALLFPWLHGLAWLGRGARPRRLGAGLFVVARKPRFETRSPR
ncbi:MAG: class I SAM-dependent methyltransferase [Deltaproteobacteria bacterium]|nr:class I SAM-dependent methyltransferase [Deltaproteobacteria bacterium]